MKAIRGRERPAASLEKSAFALVTRDHEGGLVEGRVHPEPVRARGDDAVQPIEDAHVEIVLEIARDDRVLDPVLRQVDSDGSSR